MTKKLVWRLKDKPTAHEIKELVEAGILDKESAKELIFRSDVVEEYQEDELKDIKGEVKLLRELVLQLISNQQVRSYPIYIETIRRYDQYPWTQPYITYSSSLSDTTSSTSYSTTKVHS